MLSKVTRFVHRYLAGLIAAQKSPIYILGLPRSGTTWIATVFNSAESVKYFHEPFNCTNVPGASQFCMQYLSSEGNLEFERRCRAAFAGHIKDSSVRWMLTSHYRRFPWWPGRIVIKDVCSCLSADWVYQHLAPIIVIVIRHPCAVAASWSSLHYDVDRHITAVLRQKNLIGDFLRPFERTMKSAKNFWQKIGALWGATYYVLLEQQKIHPEWIIIEHEALCLDPVKKFRELFDTLNLEWTRWTDEELRRTINSQSNQPYQVRRISAQEPEKWEGELDAQRIKQVRQFAEPFGISRYTNWS